MQKERIFFGKGLFEKDVMNSKIKTQSMSLKEKILGFMIGPFGMAALMAVVGQLAELYYTEVFYIDEIFGVGNYLIMSWVIRIVGILFGIFLGYVVEHSASRQGRFRPLVLIGSIVSAVSAFFMFFIPAMPDVLRLIWVYFFNIVYSSVGVTLVMLKTNLITLSTRSQQDRNQISLITKISDFLLVGTGVTLVVGSILYYTTLQNHPAINWIILVGIFCAISIPLSILQYYCTKERITEENNKYEQIVMPIGKQVRNLLSSKYWVMALLLTFVLNITSNLQGYNLNTNFCSVILGATAENNYNLVYTMASGIPLGLGILVIYPLCKKFTIRKTTIAFSFLVILGSIMGIFAKNNFLFATIAYFIINFGTIPIIYIIYSLIYSANDEVEYKYNYRVEGTIGVVLIGAITGLLSGLFSGVYESGLAMNGYNVALGINQNPKVIEWIYFVKYYSLIIEYVIIDIILIFMNLEKSLPQMQLEIEQQHKQQAEERGEVYVSPMEKAEKEKAENARLAELARIDDLQEKCARKGLDFEVENAKYLGKKNSRNKRENK